MVELDRRSEAARADDGRLAAGGFRVRRERHRNFAVLVRLEHRAVEPHLRALHDLAVLVQRGEYMPRRVAPLGGAEAALAHHRAARDAISGAFHHVKPRRGKLGERQRLTMAQDGWLIGEVEEALHRGHGAVEVDVARHLSLRLAACRRSV